VGEVAGGTMIAGSCFGIMGFYDELFNGECIAGRCFIEPFHKNLLIKVMKTWEHRKDFY
jgi:hypothetical protein